jgi:curved DNA-binding protein CbpA
VPYSIDVSEGRSPSVIEHRDAYAVLQVDPAAELIVIEAAYRALARRSHPDGDAPDIALMAELSTAIAILRDPARRAQLDARRALARTAAVPIAAPRSAPGTTWTAPKAGANTVLDFGRYAGWSVADLARHDPDYLRWLARHSSGIRYRSAIAAALPNDAELHRDRSSVG